MPQPYELYYWPSLQGRGEFVRLALEEADAKYIDVARENKKGAGVEALMRLLDGKKVARPAFAPPFLKAGRLLIGQTANILLFLGAHHKLAPANEAGRLWVHELQLTIADWVAEIHDTHHPIASGLYYEEQKHEARDKAEDFRHERLPKFMGYFESVLGHNARDDKYLAGARLSYADLSLFQTIDGLLYAFPRCMQRMAKRHQKIRTLYETVAARPRIAAYLKSDRRIAFNEEGIFRHYRELDD